MARFSEILTQYAISDHQGNTRILFTSATPTPQAYTATLEDNTQTAEQSNFQNYPTGGKRSALDLYDHTDAGSTYTHSYLLNGGYNSQVGLAKSFKVYPGDKVKIEAYAKYSNPSSTTSNLAGFATALLAAYGVSPPAGGESGTVASALNTWGGIVAGGGDGESNTPPHVSVNIVIFDKNYNFLDAAFSQISTSAQQVGVSPVVPHDYLTKEYTIKEGGYAFLYIVNENATQVDAYFDDVKMTYTPGNVIQSNEYYPFGMQTASSWTRDNVTGNNFLGNGGTELNTTSQVYDLDYRNYDPILGRMNQVDPLADKYGSITPYNYANNDPVFWNDESGAEFSNSGSPAPFHWSRDMEEISSSNKPAIIDGVLNPYQDLWGLVGNYGLAGEGFGFGDSYGKVSRLAMARNDALSSANGGSIDTGTGKVSFYNANEAFAAGYAYNEYHISWGTTVMGSAYASMGNYQTIQELSSTAMNMLVAYQGPGPGDRVYDGHAIGISLTAIAGGGFNITLGYVKNKEGEGSWFFSAAPGVGLDAGLSGFASDIVSRKGYFDISEYSGKGISHNFTFFGSYSRGGNSYQTGNDWGATYIEETGGYGIGSPIGYSWHKTKTWLFGGKP